MDNKFAVYSSGLMCMSVCCHKDMTREEIEIEANKANPTGGDLRWRISEDTTFKGGQPMPCECNQDSECMHWLLNC